MTYSVFFCDYCEDKVLESNDAKESSLEEILHSMDCVLHMPRNFFGIIDEENNTLQFMVNEDKMILLDIPIESKGGSYSGVFRLEDCMLIVKKTEDIPSLIERLDLEFQLWG
ncbi:hypothetical protein NFHSH190041_25470 [Shewanella sp. NFH-SH190041]|uniref:hypothetical protein n=1 Tax=Shewanella sp. NFH-SH190041 TaxID=2950245 RepID=UPI0021C286BA|nr:hypothetical protein [Shewanella sp. NFH-SH190041]BDM65095.1 hypothetical protein NFHSH190041_25470 [Shewanella sp. NFH-SH190041]